MEQVILWFFFFFFTQKIMESLVLLLLNINKVGISGYLWNQIPIKIISSTFIATKGVLVP